MEKLRQEVHEMNLLGRRSVDTGVGEAENMAVGAGRAPRCQSWCSVSNNIMWHCVMAQNMKLTPTSPSKDKWVSKEMETRPVFQQKETDNLQMWSMLRNETKFFQRAAQRGHITIGSPKSSFAS